MCQAFSTEDHRILVVITWQEAPQPFFDVSKNMVRSWGTIKRDFSLQLFMLTIHQDSYSFACWTTVITYSQAMFFSGPAVVSAAGNEIFVRISRPEVFIGKSVLKTYNKFTGEHPCRSVISIKLQCNFILRRGCSPVNLLHNTFL